MILVKFLQFFWIFIISVIFIIFLFIFNFSFRFLLFYSLFSADLSNAAKTAFNFIFFGLVPPVPTSTFFSPPISGKYFLKVSSPYFIINIFFSFFI